jgi:hypothetical protein
MLVTDKTKYDYAIWLTSKEMTASEVLKLFPWELEPKIKNSIDDVKPRRETYLNYNINAHANMEWLELSRILSWLEPYRQFFNDFRCAGGDAVLVLAIFSPKRSGGISLPANEIDRLSDLNIGIDVHFYPDLVPRNTDC